MRLRVLILLLQVGLSESSGEVFGFLGDNITLQSGADPSLSLTRIEWSILSNNTFIATYRDGTKSLNRFYQYKDRLDINVSTGDLMIYNLTTKDEMTYTVDFTSDNEKKKTKVKLTVKKRLQKPNIRTQTFLPSGRVKTGCWIEMLCSASEEGVEVFWQVPPSDVTTFNTTRGRDALLLAFMNSTQASATFNCTTSKSMVTTWSTVAPVCKDEQTHPSIQPHLDQPSTRDTRFTLVVLAAFVGCCLPVVIVIIWRKEINSSQAAVGTSTTDLAS
ncbi:uncharacterized protein si:cabz01074946.1 isoform X2 [Betta splendens]|uniref:Uncharacterized protein si:cabz01074946.1 isoform X2 n=1 Tax=Betta splendens TaxID=158456 RepID=A0A6P7LUG7_BETSP|nr:uncharacterized protein si:cabz01074946.1 isoform X2 [Betta splendens]